MITEILITLGVKKAPNVSAIARHIVEFTNRSWIQDLQATNRLKDYQINLWTE